MNKVNWMAKVDHEYLPNYKVLQAAFDRHGIERNIQVDQLIRAKYQDNLEFLQWIKCYWERSGAADLVDAAGDYGYEPAERRQGKQLPAWAVAAARAGEKENVRPRTADSGDAVKPGAVPRSAAARPYAPAARSAAPKAAAAEPKARASPGAPASRAAPGGSQAAAQEEGRDLRRKHKEEVDELQGQISNLEEERPGLEEERDYYFRRLREVEDLCKRLQEQGEMPAGEQVVADILEILYAEDAEGGVGEEPVDA